MRPRRVESFVHLLCGNVEVDDLVETATSTTKVVTQSTAPGRIEELENEVSALRESLAEVRNEVENIKSQLGI